MSDANVGKTWHASALAPVTAGNRVEKTCEARRGITVPSIYAGELCKGYLGRIASTNTCKDLRKLLASLVSHSHVPEATISEHGLNLVMAELTGIPLGKFHAMHTVLPFQKAVAPIHSWRPFASATERRAKASFNYPTRDAGSPLYLCHLCVAADVEVIGCGIWYRSHQLRGVVTCSKHGVGLRSVPPTSLLADPDTLMSTAVSIPNDIVDDALARPLSHRYSLFCELFAARTEPYTTQQMTKTISSQVLKLDPSSKNRPIRLSRFIQDQLDGRWFQEYFHQLRRVRGPSNLSSFDQAGIRIELAYPTPYYALALAALFDTTEEAMQNLAQVGAGTATAQAGGGAVRSRTMAVIGSSHLNTIRDMELSFSDRQKSDLSEALYAFANGATIKASVLGRDVTTAQVMDYLRGLVRNLE
jgi:hypothetical protein